LIDAVRNETASSVAAMAAQAWFSRNDVEVVPGTSAVFQLTIVNLGDTTETFSLTPVGLAAGWTTIRPGSVTLFGGSQEVVDVEVQPPLLPSTTAGPTALTVRIVPQSDPDDVGSSETTLQVGPTYTRRLHMLQPALRARRTAVYEMMLENQGNTQASCRLHLLDPTGRIDGDFDPPAAGVEPGASSLIRLKVHANRLQWERRSRTARRSASRHRGSWTPAARRPARTPAPGLPGRRRRPRPRPSSRPGRRTLRRTRRRGWRAARTSRRRPVRAVGDRCRRGPARGTATRACAAPPARPRRSPAPCRSAGRAVGRCC